MLRPDTIDNNIQQVISRINGAAVKVLLATKTQPIDVVDYALRCFRDSAMPYGPLHDGRVLLGENRVQELVAKAAELAWFREPQLMDRVPLHFIGPLQKNKINQLMGTPFSCIETVDTLELASAISARCERSERLMEVMVQVNVSGEASKAGCLPDDAAALALAVSGLPNLKLTGFMTIGLRPSVEERSVSKPRITNSEEIRAGYRLLREIRDSINPELELSMGMSTDLELAIAEGATIVRLGSAVFGPR